MSKINIFVKDSFALSLRVSFVHKFRDLCAFVAYDLSQEDHCVREDRSIIRFQYCLGFTKNIWKMFYM